MSFNGKQAKRIYIDFFTKIAVPGFLLMACSAPATKMKCAELQFRMDHQTLSDDEKQVFEQEIKNCGQQVDKAQQQDSVTLKKIQNRFSPQEDSL